MSLHSFKMSLKWIVSMKTEFYSCLDWNSPNLFAILYWRWRVESALFDILFFLKMSPQSIFVCVQYKKQGLGGNLTTCNQDNVIRLQKWNNCNQPRLHLQSVALDNTYICLLAACHSGSLFTFWITSLKSSIPHPQGLSRRVCFSFLNISCPTAPLSFWQNVGFCYWAHFPDC